MTTPRKDVVENLLSALTTIKKNGPQSRIDGICCAITDINPDYAAYEYDDLLEEIFFRWPKYSGSPQFPVPPGYTAYMDIIDCWDRDTEYGQLRWELLDFLIEELKKEQASAE